MTKTKYLFLLILIACSTFSSAQNVSAGLYGAYSTGSLKIKDIPQGFINTIEGDHINGFETGLFAKIKAGPLYFRPMALLNFRRGSLTVVNDNEMIQHDKFNIAKAEIPFLAGLNIAGPLFAEAGPVYNYVIGSSTSIAGNHFDFRKSGLGYRIGAGVEIGKIFLSVHYQGLRNTMGESGTSTIRTPDELLFGLGIKLGK